MEKPSWSIGLVRIGEYYEGIVNNVESTLHDRPLLSSSVEFMTID